MFITTGLSFEHHVLAGESTNSPRGNSITVPNELASGEDSLVIDLSSTNRVRQDGSVFGSTNISDLREMLQLYADVRGRSIRWSTNLAFPHLNFTTDKPLTRTETITALDAFFGLNGIALIDVGEKWVKAARAESCQTSSNLLHQTEYVAHLQHLTYVKPSELIPILQPFSSGPANGFLPLNADQAVLLRDFPQNVQRMREVIREVDVAAPTEFISEVIPIKYAKASEIADALNKSAPPEWRARHRHVAENIVPSGQDKLIADERTNSLLVYATREEMKQIKEIISHLDVVSAQFLIEAVIIEINHGNNVKFSAIDNDNIPWMTNFISNVVTNAPPPTTPAPSKKSAQVAAFYRFAAITNDLDSFVTTLASNKSARILQRPRIQTSDKEPAQLFVGESRPLPDEAYSGVFYAESK